MSLNDLVVAIQGVLADKILIVVLVGAGLWFTFNLGFIQVRAGKEGMSSFQALATAIAAQVGTGNLAGAATAIAMGGPGAIFWMWVSAFLGMATIYAEALMAQKYKQVGDDGTVTGGPVYYIRAAFTGKFGKICSTHYLCIRLYGKCSTV